MHMILKSVFWALALSSQLEVNARALPQDAAVARPDVQGIGLNEALDLSRRELEAHVDSESPSGLYIEKRAPPGRPSGGNNNRPQRSFASDLKAATKTKPSRDKEYADMNAVGYNVKPLEKKNLVEENLYTDFFPDVQRTVKNELGVDLGAPDTIESNVEFPSPKQGGRPASFKFYTSPSSKAFIIESKFGSEDLNPITGPLPARAIQQQAMVSALEGSGVKASDMKFFGEVGIVVPETQGIIDRYRGTTARGPRVTYKDDHPAFEALSNSNNGRAEFGQIIDYMHSMGLTINGVSTYRFEGPGGTTYQVFWHLAPINW